MRKLFILSILTPVALSAFAQIEDMDNVPVIVQTYAHKISHDGQWIVGESVDGGTVVYNRLSGEAPAYYAYPDFGRGYVVSNNGWTVGTLSQDDLPNIPVIMANGEVWTPDVFDKNVGGNIHSITPDGNRVCGVVGDPQGHYDNLPFYCDIDDNGNFSEIHYLPFPDKDFFGYRPQYCSATWISSDGKKIAGQMIDARGFYVTMVIYKEGADGTWSYELPAKKLFNPRDLTIPAPVQEFEQKFPDVVYPEVQNFMTALQYAAFVRDGEPYSDLDQYMNEEQVIAYYEACDIYIDAQMEYEEVFGPYMEQYFAIIDSSVGFIRNAMALSSNGRWLTAASEGGNFYTPATPFLYDSNTGEWNEFTQMGYITPTQVMNNGTVICSTPGGDIPAVSYIYLNDTKKFVSAYAYMKEMNPTVATWYEDNVTDEVLVSENADGSYNFEEMTVTGAMGFSDDMTVAVGAVDGYVLYKDMYFTYILDNLASGVESIKIDQPKDGVYNVYNLQGVRVLTTKDSSALNSLAKGIYIINGKKVLL